ncbi:MAG: T9SS type A sorting domain-containing protein [Candidatus Cloacimonetes bacterium]|nr:T9SS type A sorting domain-containing protein [Candidatus Cloacimonadota bacterium]
MKSHYNYVLLLIVALLCITTNAWTQPSYTKVYASGLYNSNQIDILYNSAHNESLIYQFNGELATQVMTPWYTLNDWQTCTITMPANHNIGFYSTTPELSLTPLFWEGNGTPPLSYFTPLTSDPLGDHLFTSAWLDITDTKVCMSQDRLYFAMRNNHTSFPVSSGLTYFAYMPIIVNPASSPEQNPIVFGLMYTVNVMGIISPGLYKITGTGLSDLVRIGNIESAVVGQSLVLSCAKADLFADQDFMAWFTPNNPLIAVTTTTSKITITAGSLQADLTEGANMLLEQRTIPVDNSFPPVLSEPLYTFEPGEQATMTASIKYRDADGNFPRIASLSIDGGAEFPLVPDTGFFGNFVDGERFTSANLSLENTWSQISYRFSDGDGFVYYTLNSSGNEDNILAPATQFSLYPNPTTNKLQIKNLDSSIRELLVYNIRGQKVLSLTVKPDQKQLSYDVSSLNTGVYFIKSTALHSAAQRFVILP